MSSPSDQGIIFSKDKAGWIVAEVPDLPGCISQGRTEAEAKTNIQEAIAAWFWADDLKKSDPPQA